jgi:hypothetical protein
MADLHNKVARGTEGLVAADAESRKDFVKVHQELQAERGRLDSSWNSLDSERRSIDRERRMESLLIPLASSLGGLVLVSVLLGFCWYALAVNRNSVDVAQLNEVLLSDVLLTGSPLLVDGADLPSSLNLQNDTDI